MRIDACVRVGLFCLIATTLSANSFSFTGSFPTDNDVQLFSFSIAADGPVTFLTLSYAGGTNAVGQIKIGRAHV